MGGNSGMARETGISLRDGSENSKFDVFRKTILPSAGLPEKASYNLREVASMFGVTRRTFYEYLRRGVITLPVYKFASGLRIYKTDLVQLFNETGVYELHGDESGQDTL